MNIRNSFYKTVLGQTAMVLDNSALDTTQISALYETQTQTAKNPLIGLSFADSQVQQGVNTLNSLRRAFAHKYGVPNMIKVKVNWNLTRAQKEFATVDNANWLYLDSGITPPPGYGHYLNFEILDQNPDFRAIAAKYPGLLEQLDASHYENLHDTSKLRSGKTNAQKLAGANQVLRLRFEKQQSCYNMPKCGTVPTFYNFSPCFNVNSSCDGNPWLYLGRGIMPEVRDMTLAFLPVQGRFAPPFQKGKTGYAYIFSLGMDKAAWPPADNYAFTAGQQVCSSCPPTHPYCDDGLCTDVAPPKPRM